MSATAPPLLQVSPDHRPQLLRANHIDNAVVTWVAIRRAKADVPAALLHLSAVGPYAHLKALWAHVLTMPARILHLPCGDAQGQRLRASRLSGLHGRYHAHWNAQPLPLSGQSHLSLTHDVALDGGAGTGRALLQPLHGPIDLGLVLALLDRHLALPLPVALAEPERALQFWEAALALGAITPLPAFGCRAFWIATEHPSWTRCVVAAILGQPLVDVPPPQVHTHGSALTVGVPITAVDEDESAADDGTNT
jgi:hypothetical protein